MPTKKNRSGGNASAKASGGAAKPSGSVTKGDGRDFKGNQPTNRDGIPLTSADRVLRWPKTA